MSVSGLPIVYKYTYASHMWTKCSQSVTVLFYRSRHGSEAKARANGNNVGKQFSLSPDIYTSTVIAVQSTVDAVSIYKSSISSSLYIHICLTT